MSFWKNLAKYSLMAAPFVAAPFTGGASLALIGAGAGAASGALSGGGVKGALLGAGLGAIPGAGGMGKAGGSMATKGALMKAVASNAGLAAAGGIGSALSGAAKGKEAERTAADNYGITRDQLGLTANTANEKALADRARLDLDQRAQDLKSRESAFQSALRASVVQNFHPAARPNGVANISFINGGPSQGARDTAAAMEHDAMQRILAGGDTYASQPAFTPYQLASSATPQKAGTLENVMGILGTGLTGYAGIARDLKKPNPYDDPYALKGFTQTDQRTA